MDLKEPVPDAELAAEIYEAAAFSIGGIRSNQNVHPMFRAGLEAAADRCNELAALARQGKA